MVRNIYSHFNLLSNHRIGFRQGIESFTRRIKNCYCRDSKHVFFLLFFQKLNCLWKNSEKQIIIRIPQCNSLLCGCVFPHVFLQRILIVFETSGFFFTLELYFWPTFPYIQRCIISSLISFYHNKKDLYTVRICLEFKLLRVKNGTFNVYIVEIISSLFCTQFFGTEHSRFAYQCNNTIIYS